MKTEFSRKEISERIRRAMDERRFEVCDIARITGLASANIRKVIRSGNCQIKTFHAICVCLGVSADVILFGKQINRRRTKWNSQ